jgi:hypothetical protein
MHIALHVLWNSRFKSYKLSQIYNIQYANMGINYIKRKDNVG